MILICAARKSSTRILLVRLSSYLTRLASLLICIGFLPSFAVAQNASPRSWKLASVTVIGAKRFAPPQIVAATGLRTGDTVSNEKLDAAAQRLSDSGAFQTVRYSFKPGKDGVEVVFEVQETKQFLKCLFDNFVWFTDEELAETLHREVPLFDGAIPPDGQLVSDVEHALDAMLRERRLQGTVQHILSGALGSVEGILFRVDGIPLSVRELRFPGASPALAPRLQAAGAQLMGQRYSRTAAKGYASLALTPVYLERGYLRVRFLEPSATLQENATQDGALGVVISLPLEEGLVYDWEQVLWEGQQAFATSNLDSMVGMKQGEVANMLKIEEGWTAVRKAYGTRGFIDVQVRSTPRFDDANRRVTFLTVLREGPQYLMGNVAVTGVPLQVANQMNRAWELKPGQVYNASYVNEFLQNAGFDILRRSGAAARAVKILTSPNRQRLTVDVTIEIK